MTVEHNANIFLTKTGEKLFSLIFYEVKRWFFIKNEFKAAISAWFSQKNIFILPKCLKAQFTPTAIWNRILNCLHYLILVRIYQMPENYTLQGKLQLLEIKIPPTVEFQPSPFQKSLSLWQSLVLMLSNICTRLKMLHQS